MSGPDCDKCGEYFLDCRCPKARALLKQDRKKKIRSAIIKMKIDLGLLGDHKKRLEDKIEK